MLQRVLAEKYNISLGSVHNILASKVWLERLPNITQGFEPKNIFNCDETGIILLNNA